MHKFGHHPRFRIDSDLVFRKHVLKMGQKPPAWTPRSN